MDQIPRICIIGGGPAGIATALRLLQNGASHIQVLEARENHGPKIGETIQPPCQYLLKTLGLWETFLQDGHQEAMRTSSAWGSAELQFRDFMMYPVGQGWQLDRAQFDRRLALVAQERGVDVQLGMRFKGAKWEGGAFEDQPGQWRLDVQGTDGAMSQIHCDFVVDASGRSSIFARSQGAESIAFDDLYGCYQFFHLPDEAPQLPGHTLIETVAEGWWYSAGLPDRRFVIAMMADKETVRELQLHGTAALTHACLQTLHTQARLSQLIPDGPVQVARANSRRLDRMQGDDWLAVGDAAAAFDPLSSMGIYQALSAGIAAADAIAAYLKDDPDALKQLTADWAQQVEDYLETKAEIYRLEQRWKHSPFWQHRHEYFTLSPQIILVAAHPEQPSPPSFYLDSKTRAHLLAQWEKPQAAHTAIHAFQANHPIPDRRLILAVQDLVQKGYLQEV